MGRYEKRFWISDTAGMNKAERLGGVYYPYVPDFLSNREIVLNASCVSAITRAQQALEELQKTNSLIDTEPLARMLLRAEAVSSSRIEGLEMPASKLMEYEELDRLGVEHRLDSTEMQVLGNIRALHEGLVAISSGYEWRSDKICELNRDLLAGTRLESQGGVIRQQQNWIGGNRVNPVNAAYVPPEAELVPALLDDLVAFLNTTELPPVASAALAHAQFETIHPFVDGNGRTGRALIHIILKAANVARATVPPVSLVLATDKERYITNLSAYRTNDGEDRISADNDWIEYFSNAVVIACDRAANFEKELLYIRDSWKEKVEFRSGSAGSLLLDVLMGTPAISIKTAQGLINRSYPATRAAVLALQEAGILRQNSKNRKSGIYVAGDILDAFNSYERALATFSGDTAVEKPRRSVPQRQNFHM